MTTQPTTDDWPEDELRPSYIDADGVQRYACGPNCRGRDHRKVVMVPIDENEIEASVTTQPDTDLYFDREGQPMSRDAWAIRFSDMAYKRVAYDTNGDVSVSTVWLGLNHDYWGGPPLIFETMIFGGDLDNYCERYSTEQAAIAGHAVMLAKAFG